MNRKLLLTVSEVHEMRRPKFEEWCKRRGLELDMDTDSWGRPKYKHPMIEAMWDGYNWACADCSFEFAEAAKTIKTLSF